MKRSRGIVIEVNHGCISFPFVFCVPDYQQPVVKVHTEQPYAIDRPGLVFVAGAELPVSRAKEIFKESCGCLLFHSCGGVQGVNAFCTIIFWNDLHSAVSFLHPICHLAANWFPLRKLSTFSRQKAKHSGSPIAILAARRFRSCTSGRTPF